VRIVVVEHKDRLGRMDVELVEAALSATGRRLVVLDDGEVGGASVWSPVGKEPGAEGAGGG
jgi:predicted site-specific integrase-resolvase